MSITSLIYEQEQPIPYTREELELGVAVNRSMIEYGSTSPMLECSEWGHGTIQIDIENDLALQKFLIDIKTALEIEGITPTSLDTSLEKISEVSQMVISFTPRIDRDNSYHRKKILTLGEAIERPVNCLDRGLAMEAVLKMMGIKNAQLMPISFTSKDRFIKHVDLQTEINSIPYIIPTIGIFEKKEGVPIPAKEYFEQIDGKIATRKITDFKKDVASSIGIPFFESIK
jgi:hypothetical protein